MNLQSVETLSADFVWQDCVGLISKALGEAAGSEKIYVNIDEVPPGAYSAKLHSHSQQEEFFLILSGTGTLQWGGKQQPVKQGDFIAKPAGKNLAHTFYNSGSETLTILDVGTNQPEDTCYYPDEDVSLHKSNGERRVYRGDSLLSNWSSEPNAKESASCKTGAPVL